jgi:hypothetical protein
MKFVTSSADVLRKSETQPFETELEHKFNILTREVCAVQGESAAGGVEVADVEYLGNAIRA